MRTMIDLGKERGPILGAGMHIIMDTPTSVDCMSLREARRATFRRSLLDCVIPACCSAGFLPDDHSNHTNSSSPSLLSSFSSSSSLSDDSSESPPAQKILTNNYSITSTRVVTGTFFGQRKGRVSFCLQQVDHRYDYYNARRRRRPGSTTTPVLLLLLEFGVPTSYLAREMQHGLLRIALVDEGRHHRQNSIFQVPTWTMYCNGRKVGFATRRDTTANDEAILKLMQSVSVGAGVLSLSRQTTSTSADDEIMYLRASFKRVIGSLDSESFHMINPDDYNTIGSSYSAHQQLSIFLLRSSS